MENTTIAAIATPLGYGGIAIIRISGKDAFRVAEKVFTRADKKNFAEMLPNTILYGHIYNENKEMIDEVLVSKFVSPRTYTTEDTVEINCHGGFAAAREVLSCVLSAGCVLAEPGEFTRRAFLGGRIDLIKAQAVYDVIEAKTSASLKAGMKSLNGELSRRIASVREMILELNVKLEVGIEYPEYDTPEVDDDEILAELKQIKYSLEKLADSYKKGEILREGLSVAIVGRPNVGKSTLLNALVGSERAIVTDIPGTTRDVVDETVVIKNIPFTIMDTAGIREQADVIETIGIKKSLASAKQADIVLFVIDASKGISEADLDIYEKIKDKTHLVIANKSDITSFEKPCSSFGQEGKLCQISAVNGTNISDIEDFLAASAGVLSDDVGEAFMVNARNREKLECAVSCADDAIGLLISGMPVDFIATDLRDISSHLAAILGEEVGDEVVDEIFARFCLGK